MPYWTTVDRPAEEQFPYWREVLCEAFAPLAPERTSKHRPAGPRVPGIESWVKSDVLTETNCAEVSSKTQLIVHGETEIRRTMSEVVFVNLQLTGHCVASQGGRSCLVRPGSFACFDTTGEYTLEFFEDPAVQEWRVVSFRVPRPNLLPLLADPEGFTGVTHDAATSAAADLVASTMLSIWRTVEGLDAGAADAAEAAFTTMLAAGVGGSEQLRQTSRETLDATLRAVINRYVAANLRTADVSAAKVARRFGVSVRKLHRLYEGTNRSYAQTVMGLRVDGCTRDLLAAGNTRSLTETAVRWGFTDLPHLNRVFRAHHGRLPSELRAAASPAIEAG
jgi:AraC-like DNA-binding protein